MTGPRVGDLAPDLTLPDTHGTPVTLSHLRGSPVALVFFPFAFSRVCADELRALRDHRDEFAAAGVTLLGVSCDAVFSLRAWSEQEEHGFDLLSDFWPHGAAARAYGVLDEEHGLALRGSFLLDAEGVVRWSLVHPRGRARPIAAYRAALATLEV